MKDRNYGIDLLRLVLMFMVCVLHSLGQGGVLSSYEHNTTGYKIFWLMEILCYCAVDSFAIISGYVASKKERKYDKLVNMWFQAFFYSFVITGIFVLIGARGSWSLGEMIASATPVTHTRFWYFTAFFALYFVMPVFNKFFLALSKKTAQKSLIVAFILFSILETFYVPFHTEAGYSFIWLAILYCIGILAQRAELFKKKKTWTLLILWGACIAFTWLKFLWSGSGELINYVSPTILLSGIIMVVLFSRLNLKGTIISKLSPLAFGIYLFQMNEVV